jgi:hypothetical protein
MSSFYSEEENRGEDGHFENPQYGQDLFKMIDGGYLDAAQQTLYNDRHAVSPVRKEIIECLPMEARNGRLSPLVDKIMMPFAQTADPFWVSGIPSGAFNNSYAPYTAMYYVIREYPREFIEMVDGMVVENQYDYEKVRNNFNRTFWRVLDGQGRGTIRGYCSVDEMIRIGSLFYVLLKTCDHKPGLVLDDDRRFSNNWGGESVIISLTPREMSQYQAKLEDVVMSDLPWEAFCYRNMKYTDEDTLWFFNVPNFMDEEYVDKLDESVHRWFDQTEFLKLFEILPLITNRGGKIFLIFKHDGEMVDDVVRYLKFDPVDDAGVYRSNANVYDRDDLRLYKHFGRGLNSLRYSVITNYAITGRHR